MKTIIIYSISVLPAGYGHNTIYIETLDGVRYATTTNNTMLTDRIKYPDSDEDSALAKVEAARLVLNENGVDYDEIVFA